MKESKKQIKAQAINECAKQFRSRIENLEFRLNAQVQMNLDLHKKNDDLLIENLKLKDQLEKYEDWNRRLQEFMDMTPKEREKHFTELQTKNKLNEKMTSFMNMFQHLGLYV